jgi:hypothetical protein
MLKSRLIQMIRAKNAKRDLVRGLAGDLEEWGIAGNAEQVTQLLLRFEKYQMDLGEQPSFEFN